MAEQNNISNFYDFQYGKTPVSDALALDERIRFKKEGKPSKHKVMTEDPANKKVIISTDFQDAIDKLGIVAEGISVNEEDDVFEVVFSLSEEYEDKAQDISAIIEQMENKGYKVSDHELLDDENLVRLELDTDNSAEVGPVEDDIPDVTRLRNLYRANRIDKNQYVGGIATLHAAGIISSAQFNRLKRAV